MNSTQLNYKILGQAGLDYSVIYCNSPRLLLADIVLFVLSLSSFSTRFLKREVSTPL